MKKAIALLALTLSACGGGAEQAATPAAPPVTTAPAETVVFVGDSITALWTLPVTGAINAGVPGNTTDQMLARYQTDVLDKHPTLVVILGGTNDLRHIPNATIDNISRMADLAAHANARVIIGTIPPINDWSAGMPLDATAGNQAVHDWNRDLKNLAAGFGYTIVDYYPKMVLSDDSQNATLFNADRLHPNDAGYAVMWDVLHPLVH